jgi:molybdenum cofactor cytidylyltransferase
MLRLHVEAARAAGLRPRVVLGPDAAAHLRVLPPGVEVVWNARALRTDMAASAALGLEGLAWALLTPVDVPPAHPDTLRALLDHPGPCVPVYGGREGHPVRIHARDDGCHPAERLDHRLRDAARIRVGDPTVLRDLDTPEAWAAWRAERDAAG